MTVSVDGLGAFLRTEREKRGITSEQVASATKINIKLIHALEADQYVELPAKPFVRGFAISYARYIGLDPQGLLAQFTPFLDEQCTAIEGKRKVVTGYAFEETDESRNSKPLWVLVVLCLIVGGGSALHFRYAKKAVKKSHLDELKGSGAGTSDDGMPVPQILGQPTTPQATQQAGQPTAQSASQPTSATSPVTAPGTAAPSAPAVATVQATALAKPVTTPPVTPTVAPPVVVAPIPPLADAAGKPTPPKKTGSSLEPGRQPSAEDPMNKGDTLKPEEILQKLVFRTKGNVWVRYKTDERAEMMFRLEQGKTLVLRANEKIWFQASQPDRIEYRMRGSAFSPLQGAQLAFDLNGSTTVVVPAEARTLKNPFEGRKPVPAETP